MAGLIGAGTPDPREPVMIDDVAMVGLMVDEFGNEAVTICVLSPTQNLPIALWRALTPEQVGRIQVALGQKLRALRE